MISNLCILHLTLGCVPLVLLLLATLLTTAIPMLTTKCMQHTAHHTTAQRLSELRRRAVAAVAIAAVAIAVATTDGTARADASLLRDGERPFAHERIATRHRTAAEGETARRLARDTGTASHP